MLNDLKCFWSEGCTRWRDIRGELHRLDGPAVEQTNGQKEWWVDGELHRLDGPAIEYVSGLKEWCISGEYVSKQDFNSAVISFLLNCDKKNALVLRNIIQTHREHDV